MGTWIVGGIVLGIVLWAGYRVYKDRKDGKGCSGGCGSCEGCPKARERA